MAKIIERHFDSADLASALKSYEEQTLKELSATEWLVSALYANMNEFPLFTWLSLLYFAAASFAEAARRMGRPHLAPSFLLTDHPVFGPQTRSILQKAMGSSQQERAAMASEIKDVIEPVDVAGLGKHDRNNWYPVQAEDLVSAAGKLGASEQEIRQFLHRSGFYSQQRNVPQVEKRSSPFPAV